MDNRRSIPMRTTPCEPAAPPRLELVTRGDDSGSCIAANKAVEECFREGVLRNTSVMAVGDALEDAAARFTGCDGLCIGLHVTLNSEWAYPRYRPILPVERVRSLVGDDGCFLPTPRHLHERGFDLDEAISEVEAQLARLRAIGLTPTYLDQHMGVGWLPGLGDRLLELARREQLVPADTNVAPLPRDLNPPSNDPCEALIRRLTATPSGRFVLITHPLLIDDETHAIHGADNPPGRVAHQRDGDRRLLLDLRLARFMREHGVRPTRYTD